MTALATGFLILAEGVGVLVPALWHADRQRHAVVMTVGDGNARVRRARLSHDTARNEARPGRAALRGDGRAQEHGRPGGDDAVYPSVRRRGARAVRTRLRAGA